MSPYQFFLLTLGLTAAAVAANLVHRRRRQRRLQELARDWRMHYSPRDVFRLGAHVLPRVPEVGAADMHVHDVIYGIENEWNRYLFTVEYTAGVIHAKRREVRVASFREPRGRSDPGQWTALELADPQLPLLEQYRALRAAQAASGEGETALRKATESQSPTAA